jgi:hypothetical protein
VPLVSLRAGVIKACLRKDDYISSTYRDHVHALSKGVSARKIMSELFGKKTGCCRGQGGSMHMFDHEHGLVSAFLPPAQPRRLLRSGPAPPLAPLPRARRRSHRRRPAPLPPAPAARRLRLHR